MFKSQLGSEESAITGLGPNSFEPSASMAIAPSYISLPEITENGVQLLVTIFVMDSMSKKPSELFG